MDSAAKQNPLLPKKDQPTGESRGKSQPELMLRFVGLQDKRQVEDLEIINQLLSKMRFDTDFFEYKVVKKTETRRPINPKFPDGPKQKVIVEERINVNSDLKTVRQLEWRVLKDSENVLLLQINRAKGESFCLTLIFEKIFENDRQILISGLTNQVRLQLITVPDLKFQTIPATVKESVAFKEQLLNRASRARGMQATARELLDFPNIPPEMAKKIINVATGKSDKLTEAESINLILLSDLVTRYLPALQTFQQDVLDKVGSVAQLTRQFASLTKNISTKALVARLKDYLGEDAASCKTNAQVFQYIYQRLQQMKEGKLFVKGKLLDTKELFSTLRSMICISRSQHDPELWNKCLFFLKPEGPQPQTEFNLHNIRKLISQSEKQILLSHAASSRSLIETYIINNIPNQVIDKRIYMAENAVPPVETALIKGTIAPRLLLKNAKNPKKKSTVFLFNNPKITANKVENSLHCVGAAYGFLINSLFKQTLSRFFEEDRKSLMDRFGKNLFDVLYEQAVLETGLPVSRNDFSKWFEAQQLVLKIKEFGYIPNELEKVYDKDITPPILLGNGQSLFPIEYTEEEFEKDYLRYRAQYLGFFDKLKKVQFPDFEDYNPAKVMLQFVEEGHYNIRSSSCRPMYKNTFLFEELHRVVQESCKDISSDMELEAKFKKLILKIPFKFESLLFIGNTFEISAGGIMTARLHAQPVDSAEAITGLSGKFAANLTTILEQAESPERKALVQAIKILDEYKKAEINFQKYLTVSVLDRLIQEGLKRKERINVAPSEIKYFLSDNQKMIVGNMRDLNIGKLLRFDRKGKKEKGGDVDHLTFGEMLEAILYFKSVMKSINSRKKMIVQILAMLNRFSKTLKQGQEWKNYSGLINKFHNLISLPIDQIDEKSVRELSRVSAQLNSLVTKREYKDSAVAILHAEWKRKKPDHKKDIYFYTPFIEDDVKSQASNVLKEVRRGAQLMRMLKQKKALLYFPEASKKRQFKQMLEIGKFIEENGFEINQYVETRTLEKDQIKDLTRNLYPNNFFRLDKLEPTPKEARKAAS